jgi:hypothetical protein
MNNEESQTDEIKRVDKLQIEIFQAYLDELESKTPIGKLNKK